MTTKEFIKKAKKLHRKTYDYSKAKYKSVRSKIKIICKIHGSFNQVAGEHLRGSGCNKCSIDKRKLTTKEFIKKAKRIHKNTYDYSKAKYVSYHSYVRLICPKHGEFKQMATDHLSRKMGCGKCAREKNKISILKRKLKAGLSLKHQFPKIYAELHPTKNKTINTKIILSPSVKKLWWLCPRGHSYETIPNNRTANNSGCPLCKGQSSKFELKVFSAFKSVFRRVNWRKKINGIEIDISSNKFRFAVEVDGYPWHKSSEKKDLYKINSLKKLGYLVVNIRDSRNPKINGNIFNYINQDKINEMETINKSIKFIAKKINFKKNINIKKWYGKNIYQNLLIKYPGPTEKKSLGHLQPHLIKAWSNKNHLSVFDVWQGSKELFKWNCLSCDIQFLRTAKSSKRKNGGYCIKCIYKKNAIDRRLLYGKRKSLAKHSPYLAKEWSNKNKYSAKEISYGSNYIAHWKCANGHNYYAPVKWRTRKNKSSGCPHC